MVVTRTAAACFFALAVAGCGPDLPTGPSVDSPSLVCGDFPVAGSALDYGSRALDAALSAAGGTTTARVVTVDDPAAPAALAQAGVALDPRPESFAIVESAGAFWVVGRDEVGAMYGALELAERLQNGGSGGLSSSLPIVASPSVTIRAANLFLVLPADDEPAWWFCDSDFWTQYLDLLARARINFLDLHGMYDLRNTLFPNALLYFANSQSHPDVGVAQATRARLVGMLRTIVAMASARGIRVGLMTYRSDLSVDAVSSAPDDDPTVRSYTREAAADLARSVPGLARIGFRIGESGHDAAWYQDTIIAGAREAGTGVGIYTRTWGATKNEVMSIVGAAGGDVIVEAKMNGEQLAAPYAIAGGHFTAWHPYSYEDYLDPPIPYSFVFQVRSGGTHRMFRQASFERARRTVPSFVLGQARGFTLEAPHAYFPQRDDYHAIAEDRFSPWTFRRDELEYLLYGRLAYDPTTPASVFRAALAERVATDGLWEPMQAASEIIPWAQLAETCGPDQRDYAPDLEWGGTVAMWASPDGASTPGMPCQHHGAFDSFSIASPDETARDLVSGIGTARVTPPEIATIVSAAAAKARVAGAVAIDPANAEARDVVRECLALADFGDYLAHKLRAATALAVYRRTAASDYLVTARSEIALADTAWLALAADTAHIAPFQDAMRMCQFTRYCDDPTSFHWVKPFHWREEAANLPADPESIDAVEHAVKSTPPTFAGTLPSPADWLDAARTPGPTLSSFTIEPPDPRAERWTVTATFATPPPPGSSVKIVWKGFSGLDDWLAAPATGDGVAYQSVIAGTQAGAYFAIEVNCPPSSAWRYPDVRAETPFIALPPGP
jgi:hypothetical protein